MRYLWRQAPLKADPQNLLPGAISIIAVSLNYNQPNPPTDGMPHIARYALGRDYHKVLRSRLRKLQSFIERSHPNSRHRVCVDSAPIHEREYAHKAGLGWFGKNTMLIDSKRGSWFVIGLLLSTVDFEPDQPAIGACGKCTKCIDACPTGAIVQRRQRWQIDARRCISYLTIEHKGEIDNDLEQKIAPWTFGCDVCQEVCPFNQERASQPERAPLTTVEDFLAKRHWPSLEQLANISEDQWDVLTRGSPVRRTGLDGLRRIAHVGLAKPRGKT
jgi:epoxyqueuosine reductase